MGNNSKKFLDSVHGNIYIPDIYVENIIDTVYFQRLRRIEQTSCRSIFPSARHDRFIHSLGVYHLGCKIVESIKASQIKLPNNNESVFKSYELACLLHDVGHSPFSHTFENYYEAKDNLNDKLIKRIGSKQFKVDIANAKDMKPHEKMSALLLAEVWEDFFVQQKAELELIVRMVIGCYYQEQGKSFENAMIQLIHGDNIDADRLDYALRDVWAAGYNAASINVQRIIDNVEIKINDNKEYFVCFSSKALNEIESVLNVKNFQNLYIFNHHKIVYEQYLLVEAMKSAAEFHYNGKITHDENIRNDALYSVCQFNSMSGSIECPSSKYTISHPMDDDFVTMMKYIHDDEYIEQWFSRKYQLKPLWKSKAEFCVIFEKIINQDNVDQRNRILEWLSSGVRLFLIDKFNLSNNDVWVTKFNTRYSQLEGINIDVNGNIVELSKLHHDSITASGDALPFSYIFVRYEDKDKKQTIINEIIKKAQEMISNYFEL